MTRVIASFFGTGLILGRIRGSDIGSGTLAGLVAAIAAFGVGSVWGWIRVLGVAVVMLVVGTVVANRLAPETGDAGWIVIDEATGAFVALIGVISLPAAVVSFVVFRAADIFKNRFPGVLAAENLPGGRGIMGDDLIAGLYGLAAGHIVQALI